MILPSDSQPNSAAHASHTHSTTATPADAGSKQDQPAFSEETNPLIPVRMLNEFTYCPRLGYLEWVQGEWAENIETMQGSFGHRNVDKPDRKSIPSRKKPAANTEEGSSG